MTDIHSCSYYCDRPECIKAQRDELRDRLAQPEQEPCGEPYFNPMRKVGEWVELTTADRKEIERQSVYVEGAIRMTEAKSKERNT